jgi:hypothetical protein
MHGRGWLGRSTNSGTFTEGDLTINRNGLLLAGMPVGRSSPSCTPKGDKPSPKADNEKESTLIRSRPSSANSQGSCSSPPPPCSSAPPPGDDAVDEPSTVRVSPSLAVDVRQARSRSVWECGQHRAPRRRWCVV